MTNLCTALFAIARQEYSRFPWLWMERVNGGRVNGSYTDCRNSPPWPLYTGAKPSQVWAALLILALDLHPWHSTIVKFGDLSRWIEFPDLSVFGCLDVITPSIMARCWSFMRLLFRERSIFYWTKATCLSLIMTWFD